MNRRGFLGLLGAAMAFTLTKGVIGQLPQINSIAPILEPAEPKILAVAQYANSSNIVAALKELYAPYMENLIYKENPWISLVKQNSPYVTVPLEYIQ